MCRNGTPSDKVGNCPWSSAGAWAGLLASAPQVCLLGCGFFGVGEVSLILFYVPGVSHAGAIRVIGRQGKATSLPGAWRLLVILLMPGWLGSSAGASQWVFLPSWHSHTPDGTTAGSPASTPEPTIVQPRRPHLRPKWLSASRRCTCGLAQRGSASTLSRPGEWVPIFGPMGHGISLPGPGLLPLDRGATPQGPWTPLLFGAWVNPYGLGRLPSSPLAFPWTVDAGRRPWSPLLHLRDKARPRPNN